MSVPPHDPAAPATGVEGQPAAPACPIADGHADSLLWNRDLTIRQRRGAIDFPRLRQAGVRLQCFTVVTHGYPVVGGVRAVALWRRWPRAARRGPWARCRFQVERLHALCARSSGAVQLAATDGELERALGAGAIAAILGVEGGQALEGRPERIQELRAQGVAFMGLTHLSNNELGGSSTRFMGNRPLTALGRKVLEAMGSAGMAVDLAHASHRTFADVLEAWSGPVLCSHTGVAGVTPGVRNLEDPELRALAERGGVAGIIYATVYLGGRRIDDVVRHVLHALRVGGEDAVGLGSDFDGMIPLPDGVRDVTDVPKVVDALARHVPWRVAEKVAWGNWRRFFGEALRPRRIRAPARP